MINTLKDLCLLDAVSGNEASVREYIIERLKNKCEYTVDALGNVIAFSKGNRRPKNKLMISAHMDEVGFIITNINDNGTLSFSCVGGIDTRVIFGRQVMLENGIVGVVGGKALHNLSADEKDKAPSINDIVIDIGAKNYEEAKEHVKLGSYATFVSDFTELGADNVKCKAIDDRAGCAMMLRMIDEQVEYDTYFTFVVQEEIGLRGATCAAYTVAPEYAIILEATTAADIPSASSANKVCTVGGGPVVSYMDSHTLYDKELYNLAFNIANENDIPCQTKTRVAGGNDAGAIQISRSGVKVCAISLPCRYLHSSSCVISKTDFENSYRLLKLISDRIYSL